MVACVLELDAVRKYYRSPGEQVHAVDGVSFVAAAGEVVCLRGPSGSGKSTLLQLSAALLVPDAGRVRFCGRDLACMTEAESADYLRRDVGFIAQSPALLPRTSALENASVKLLLDGFSLRAARRQARPWLARVGLSERAARTPEQLSGGELQRLALARALAAEPTLVLADEPTASLDSAGSSEIVRLLSHIAHAHGTTVVLVTHDAETASLADRSFLLRDGQLIDEQASPESTSQAGSPGHGGSLAVAGTNP